MKKSRTLRVVAILGLVGAIVLVWLGVDAARAKATTDAARDAAATYVDLIATGDEADLGRLWAMTSTESPGALRAAGEMLVGAEERIEVVGVGDVETAPDSVAIDLPYPVSLDHFVQVEVSYRLDGEEHDGRVVLGRLDGDDGADVSDWRVVGPLMGAFAWDQPGFTDVSTDVYVSGLRQVRRPLLIGGGDEDVQPLYPAVYATQARLDPWFASDVETVAVVAGEATTPPDHKLDPTERTQDRIRGQVRRAFDRCGTDDIVLDCPVDELVEDRGVDTYRRGWWLGLTREPQIEVDRGGITLTGGAFRFRDRDGSVREMTFRGTGRYLIDNQSWTPVLAAYEFEIEETAR